MKALILKVLLLGILSSWFISCQKNDQKTRDKLQIVEKPKPIDQFKQIRNNADKFVIKHYKLDKPDVLQNLSNVVWIDSIKSQNKIIAFNNLFDSIKNGGYCCCAKTNYSISFYKQDKEIQTYNVDIESEKNNVLFFDNSYQTSYRIPIVKWKKYLSER